MKTEIIDLVVPSKTNKPIELVYCLQDINIDCNHSRAWCAVSHNTKYKSITRLATLDKNTYSILPARDLIKADNEIWLGHWNDGVVNE